MFTFYITLKKQRIPLTLDWSCLFLLVIGLFFYISHPLVFLFYLLCRTFIIFLHEIGHACFCIKYNLSIKAIVVHFMGGYCRHSGTDSPKEQFFLASGGILFQFILALISLLLFYVLAFSLKITNSLAGFILMEMFVFRNLFLLALNLLPIPGFDGHYIWKAGNVLWRNRKDRPRVNPFKANNPLKNRIKTFFAPKSQKTNEAGILPFPIHQFQNKIDEICQQALDKVEKYEILQEGIVKASWKQKDEMAVLRLSLSYKKEKGIDFTLGPSPERGIREWGTAIPGQSVRPELTEAVLEGIKEFYAREKLNRGLSVILLDATVHPYDATPAGFKKAAAIALEGWLKEYPD